MSRFPGKRLYFKGHRTRNQPANPIARTHMPDSPLFDAYNAAYAQDLFERFARNPESVPASWRTFFQAGVSEAQAHGLLVPEGLNGNGTAAAAPPAPLPAAPASAPAAAPAADPASIRRLLEVVARATSLVQAFRDHGHQLARIDPLGSEPPGHPQLDPAFFGTSMEELQQIPASVVLGNGGDESLAATLERLREAYCGSIGYQFEHLEDPDRVRWLWNEVESGAHTRPLSKEDRLALLERLSEVEGLERFLHKAYLGQKRFSLEGNDMLVPMIDLALEEAARNRGKAMVLGMAHRGRLNVLAHIMDIPYEGLVGEFEGGAVKRGMMAIPDPGTGDVKYHHGARSSYALRSGETMDVELVPNPSHLEFVNPVVSGMARVRQFESSAPEAVQDTDAVVPLLIHGDAAFAAEGVVAEALNMARLSGYTTGGALHIICNNQVGFTTDPGDGRSTRYASDLAKGYDIPVLHVNADDPPACLAAMRLAMAYRGMFHDDVVIDLVGYRRHGHNEADEPGYTQPTLYSLIEQHPTVRSLWAQRLVEEGDLREEDAVAMEDAVTARLREAQDTVRGEAGGEGAAAGPEAEETRDPDTSVPMDDLVTLNALALRVPEGFRMHPKLRRQLERRGKDFGPETKLEWAHAESLALASLLQEGVPVRFTGQDAQRGTFSHRHLVLHDHESGAVHTPLATAGPARFEIFNSPLTETAVLGFEYGYSVGSEVDLVLWEAQFGDFVNVAQVIIDQFLSAGRAKWGQVSGLTLLLPHGHEGQGPEHSSARLERFLQLCAEDNMRVAYPSTPAQYFHLLRRQALTRPRRPLIVMTPKSLLRHPLAVSTPEDLAAGAFQGILDDPEASGRRESVTRLVLCSGKIFYDLWAHEAREGNEAVAIARLEQFYPFPTEALEELVGSYPNLKEVVWTQEEPRNMGGLAFVGPRLRAVVPRQVPLRYVARPERASPAEGKAKAHTTEQDRIARETLRME